jgi:ribosomal protein L31
VKILSKNNKMKNYSILKFNSQLICFLFITLRGFSAYSQQMEAMNTDSSTAKKHNMKEMNSAMTSMAHPFYTHMGMPQSVGKYSLRFAALQTLTDSSSVTDFNLQFETGLTKFAGLLVRLDNDKAEIMFHILAIKSKNGMNGFSPLFELEIPTHEDIINTQVGFSTTLSNSRVAFHQVIHYGLQEKNFEGSVALVLKVSKRIFLISEFLGEQKQDEELSANILAGIKIRVNNNLLLAFGYQIPVTKNRDFTSQFILQPDLQLNN